MSIVSSSLPELTEKPAVFYVIISEKGGAERREGFEQHVVTVGRVQGNDLMLPKGNVSKRHCSVELKDGRFVVTDQNSTNGTYVNRRRISQPTTVRQGDRIYVGDFVLRIEDSAENSVTSAPRISKPPPVSMAPGEPLAAPVESVVPEVPRPSMPLPEARRTLATLDQPPILQPTAVLMAARTIIDVVTSKLEPRALERAQDPAVQRRVERLAAEAAPSAIAQEQLLESDGELVAMLALDELLRLGPLAGLLADADVTEVAFSGAMHGSCIKNGQLIPAPVPFCSSASIERVASRLCRAEGLEFRSDNCPVRYWLPGVGAELEVISGSVAPDGALLRLTKRVPVSTELDDLVRAGTVSRGIASFLRHCVQNKANILLAGPRESGVDDVLSGLASAVVGERLVAVGPYARISLASNPVLPIDVSALEGNEVTELLGATARLPGHRLLVSPFVGDQALATLSAAARGARGILACVPTRSALRGLSQVCSELAWMRGLGLDSLAEGAASTFDLAIEVSRLADGRSRVTRLSEIGRGPEGLTLQTIFEFVAERTATGGAVEGTFRASGHMPTLVHEFQARGVRIDQAIFTRSLATE